MISGTRETWIRIMDLYNSGFDKEATTAACDELKGFVIQLANSCLASDPKSDLREDLQQEGYWAICESIHKYDPTAERPSTFFAKYIRGRMYAYLNTYKNAETKHEAAKVLKIQKAIKSLLEKDPDNAYDPISISIEIANQNIAYKQQSGTKISERDIISPTVVQQTMHRMERSFVFLDDEEDSTQIGATSFDPEVLIQQKELSDILRSACSHLTNTEKNVLKLATGVDLDREKGYSYTEISKIMGLPLDQVKKTYTRAISKLRNDNDLLEFFNGDTPAKKTSQVLIIPLNAAQNCQKDMESIILADGFVLEA